jgi:hypothetical protein
MVSGECSVPATRPRRPFKPPVCSPLLCIAPLLTSLSAATADATSVCATLVRREQAAAGGGGSEGDNILAIVAAPATKQH